MSLCFITRRASMLISCSNLVWNVCVLDGLCSYRVISRQTHPYSEEDFLCLKTDWGDEFPLLSTHLVKPNMVLLPWVACMPTSGQWPTWQLQPISVSTELSLFYCYTVYLSLVHKGNTMVLLLVASPIQQTLCFESLIKLIARKLDKSPVDSTQ